MGNPPTFYILTNHLQKRKLIDKNQYFWYNTIIMKKLSNYLISGLVISSIVTIMAQAPVLAANIFDGGLHSGLQQGKTSEMPTTIFGSWRSTQVAEGDGLLNR